MTIMQTPTPTGGVKEKVEETVEGVQEGVQQSAQHAYGWFTEARIADILAWLYVVGCPIATVVFAYLAWVAYRRTTVRTRLGTSLILLYVSIASIFFAFALLAINSTVARHGWADPAFWWTTVVRIVLALAIIFVTVAGVRTTADVRRTMEHMER